ncbi:MAG TPA: hypothetical protein VGR21_07100, partial [Cryptosporangiaceae bacterium]|nr:hypothetical protein [Cryptosporangiaceae bacterium]
ALVGSPAAGRDTNSAQRLAALHGVFEVPPEVAAGVGGASVLLVDDRAESRWTLTVTARLLRHAGADVVLPLVLGLDA